VNGRTLDNLYAELLSSIDSESNPEASILALGHTYLAFSKANVGRWKMIFEHRLPENAELPEWYYEKIKAIFQLVEQQLAIMQPTLSAEALKLDSRAIWSGVHGICILSLTGKLDITGGAATELAEHLIRNYLKGSVL